MKRNQSFQKQLSQIEQKVKNRDYHAALDLLESLYLNHNTDLHINLLMGEMHLSIGQYRESEKYFKNALTITSNHFQALYGLGKIGYLKGEYSKALGYLEKAHQFAPDRFDICRDLAEVNRATNRENAAEKYFLKAAKLANYNNESLLYLLDFYSGQGDVAVANQLIKKYYSKSNADEELRFRKAIIDIQNKQYDIAIKELDSLISKTPTFVDALYHRGFCYLNINEVDNARADFKKCLEISPDSDDIHAILALTYTLEGKMSHTIDVWKEFFPIFTKKTQAQSSGFGKIQPMKIIDSLENREKQENVDLSIVIPVFNEEKSLMILYEKIISVLSEMEKSYEIIFIDDGSQDKSLHILEQLSLENKTVTTLKFRRNYGQTAAFAAGFKYASGDIIITMDADLQNDPADIPNLLEKMSEGYDLVSGWRKNRQDKNLTRKIPSKIANRIINKLIAGTGIKIHDFGCSLKAYKKAIVKRIKLYGEMHRFIPAYAAWLGIKVTEIPVNHHSRKFGEAKYGLERIWRVVLDLITLRFYTGFRTHPVLFFGKFSFITVATGVSISIILFLMHQFFRIGITGQTFLIFILFTMLGGLQFIIVGLLSEIITRGFFESRDSKEYIVEEIIKQDSEK